MTYKKQNQYLILYLWINGGKYVKRKYIEYEYENKLNLHVIEHCDCDLTDGGKGICIYGQYLEKSITAEEFLKEIGDQFYELHSGTFIRNFTGDVAIIIGITKISRTIYFKLDRDVILDVKNINNKSNMIPYNQIRKCSNRLKDLVEVGDIANGKQIIKIKDGVLYYGHWGDQRILGEVYELLTQNNYNNNAILS